MLGKVIIENGQKKIQALTADTGIGAPVGSYLYLEKKSNPQGYLYCDGSTFDETVYPALYQYLGTNVLPDWREMGAKGAEKNTTSSVIATHDVFTQGQEKDDCLQDHRHGAMIADYSVGGSGSAFLRSGEAYRPIQLDYTTDDVVTYGNARKGTVTRGKSKAVFIYIKATSGLTENQQEDVLNTINENNSYSTEEHPTGKKWIDGKPIYRRSFLCSGTFTGTANVWNDITTKFTDLSGLIANISSLISANLHNRFPNNDSPLHQLTLGEYILHYPSTNNISVYLLAGQTIREGAVLVVEYTKTTD